MSAPITVSKNLTFHLQAASTSYSFYVSKSGDLIHSHFGGTSNSEPNELEPIPDGGWLSGGPETPGRAQREFPEVGGGDFRQPAIRLRHNKGTTVTSFKYNSHEVIKGKPALPGLPSTFGDNQAVSTLFVHLVDDIADISATLSYSVFPKHNAIVRSFSVKNLGQEEVIVEAAASFSVDLPHSEEGRQMIQLSGDWASEADVVRRKVHPGLQGVQSLTGFSSHLHNPFIALVNPSTTEHSGDAYGFSLVYSGSFAAIVEQGSTRLDRVLLGMNPLHLSWPIKAGETFTAPEVVAVYSNRGLGAMSRSFHRLYRDHLSRSEWTHKPRPVLINNWEATYFDFDQDKIFDIASRASDLGCKLMVLDDGWFGTKHPRNGDSAGLGDWQVNEKKLAGGLDALVSRINALKTSNGEGMKFGLWIEPEHVNPKSEVYEAHPEWVLQATGAKGKVYPTVQQRNQLILDLSQPAVQDHLIQVIGDILSSTNISYIKWDHNKGIEQLPNSATSHAYLLGLYRVVDNLISRFPHILWEGCASGGGRFDPGLLHYWPGSWTSDCTDPVERLKIQTGTSMVYPPSSMSGHVSASPNHQTERATPLEFRAHVAMLCGSFGFELDPVSFTDEEKKVIPTLISLSEKISPYIIQGDLYRLASPFESNWPAFLYLSEDRSSAVLLAYQVYNKINVVVPSVHLQGLDREATYEVEGKKYTGDTLTNVGLRLAWKGDYQSRVIFIKRV